MASKNASQLKTDWVEIPVDGWELLTFKELKVGQKFICLPCPGDNSGHGGFRRTHYIFTKTDQQIIEAVPDLLYVTPHGRAVDNRGISSDFPDSTFVILVE